MYIVFFGASQQDNTALCKELFAWIKKNSMFFCHYLDHNRIKSLFDIKAIGQIGDNQVCSKIIDLARYERSLNDMVLIAAPFMQEKNRKLLSCYGPVMWVHVDVTASGDQEGFEAISAIDAENVNFVAVTDTSPESQSIIVEQFRNFRNKYASKTQKRTAY
jgi:uncharacterized protein YdaL